MPIASRTFQLVTELAESLGKEFVFNGDNLISAFKGKGKVGPLKKRLRRTPRFHSAFSQFGVEWTRTMQQHALEQVKQFVVWRMVGEDQKLTTRIKAGWSTPQKVLFGFAMKLRNASSS